MAVDWALAHPCELRQTALVLDWAGDQITEEQRKRLLGATCPANPSSLAVASRDALFMQVAAGADTEELVERTSKPLLAYLQSHDWQDPRQLYAAFEYLYTVRSVQHVDLRESDPRFFQQLPAAFLLALEPKQTEQPDWWTHAAGLALVAIDPNLPAAQFLQGWAMEDRQMVREGEGVAYELLWADPYLPGVGYENMDPWSYGEDGTLLARTDWNQDACWVQVLRGKVQQEDCPNGWQTKTMAFGRLTLVPMTGNCIAVPRHRNDESVIVSQLRPSQPVHFILNGAKVSQTADPSGMWLTPGNADGEVCTSLDTLKVPQGRKSTRISPN